MNAPLVTCPSCARHVRGDAARCPFCDASASVATPVAPSAVDLLLARQVGRLSLFAAGLTALAGAVEACGGGPTRYGAPPAPMTDERGGEGALRFDA